MSEENNISDKSSNLKVEETKEATSPATLPQPKTPGKLATESGAVGGERKLTRTPRHRPRRRRRRWIFWLLLLVVVIGAGVGYYFWQNSTQTPVGFQGQTTPASSRSPVNLTVSASGQVQANAELKLSFGSGGTITEVLVKQGDPIKKGQVIARIDDHELQNNLKTAEANLKAAQAELDKVKAGSTEEDIKKAEEQVKQAKLKAEQTRNGNALPSEIESARSKLEAAKAKLAQTKEGGSPAEKAKAQSAVSSAEADLASAQAKLDKLQSGPVQNDITSAQLKVDGAQIELEKTKSNLYKQVIDAQVARDQALTALNKAQDAYSDIFNKNHEKDKSLKSGVKDEDLQKETNAYRDLQDAQGNYNKADIALNDAKVNYDSGIRKAQNSLDQAKADLEKVKAAPSESDLAAAQAGVASAKSNLENVKANLLKLTPTTSDLASAQSEVDSAQASLAKLVTGGTENEIAQQESNVRVQELTLEALLKAPASSDIATKQAQLDLKQADYDKAQTALEAASLKAPYDGVLATLSVVPGQVIGAATEIAQLIDDSELHVDVSIGEADISKIKLNQAVTFNFEAIPNRTFTGKITFISPKAQVNSNVVSYVATVTLDGPGKNSLQEAFPEQYQKYQQSLQQLLQPPSGPNQAGNNGQAVTPGTNQPPSGNSGNRGSSPGGTGPQGGNFTFIGPGLDSGGGLPTGPSNAGSSQGFCGYTGGFPDNDQSQPKVGMTANVTVCLDVRAGTLSVSSRTIKTKIENNMPVSYVEVLEAGDKIVQKTVITGLRGDSSTEITGGELKEGDQVITSTGPVSTSPNPSDNDVQFSSGPAGAVNVGGPPVIINR